MSQHKTFLSRSPLVGRTDELRHLELCWSHARTGNGNAVLIAGEAGIGKSRLVMELEDFARADEALVMRFQCSPLQSNSDFYPIQDYLARWAGARRTEPEHLRYSKIQRVLTSSTSGQIPAKLLQGLVAIGSPSKPTDVLQSPRRKRQEVLEVLLEGLTELAAIKPLLFILEDAQWLDPTTSELMEHIVRRAASQRLLTLVTARRDYDPGWIGTAHTSVVIPRRLNGADTLALAIQISGSSNRSSSDLQHLADRSEGVPLFIEELSREKAVVGAGLPDAATIPAGLQALLMARLDTLGPAKRVAQVAAALGRRFSHDVLAFACDGTEAEFNKTIERLMAAEFLLTKPIMPGSHYSFRHVLFQEAAYASLLRQQRAIVHGKIVHALGTRAPDVISDHPEIMAHHADHAELHFSAAEYWLAAGKASAARGSVVEAVNSLKMGLASVERCPPGVAKERLDFELNMDLGPALMALKGYASDDGLATFRRARTLLDHSRSSLEEIHVLLGLFNVHFGRAEFLQALDVGQQANRLLSVGYGGYPVLVGQTQCMMGNFIDARRSLEQTLNKYDPTLDANSGLFCRADVVATAFLAKVEFSLGNLDRSSELTRTTMDLARAEGHPLALAIAFLGQLLLATEAADWGFAQKVADEALAHVKLHSLENYRLWLAFHRAALSLRTNPNAAIATMHQILGEADAAGTQLFRPAQLGLLGAAYAGTGRKEDALSIIDQGLEIARETQGLEAAPALLRLRAKLLSETNLAAAIEDLEASLAMARHQSARMEELRSATVLARILKDTDRRDYAKDLLARIFGTFSQGHEFPDLKQAERVLASFAAIG
jgi:tetratricopeptide (TPR) repeat protein